MKYNIFSNKHKTMKKNSLYYVLVLLCAVVQGAWAQTPTPSTELEPYITTLSNRMVYKFNYPSTSVTGEPVVLSSLLCQKMQPLSPYTCTATIR